MGLQRTTPRFLLIFDGWTRRMGPADDTYIKILDEAGFLHTAGFGMVDFVQIPRELKAHEAERFVLENGAKICGRRGAQNPGGPKIEGNQKRSGRAT